MSMESATKFYETLEKDTDLQKKISEMKDKSEIENLVNNVLGYDFSQEEMQKVIFDRNPELSDEELEAIVGGFELNGWVLGGGIAAALGLSATTGALIGTALFMTAASAG